MACNCKKCQFYDVDYEWDDFEEEEIEKSVCRKGKKLRLKLPFRCPFFKEYIPKPYVEKFTECDTCEHINSCVASGAVIESTHSLDSCSHYIKGRNCYCEKRDGTFSDKKLSEIIELADREDIGEIAMKVLRATIEKYGDITYAERVRGGIKVGFVFK